MCADALLGWLVLQQPWLVTEHPLAFGDGVLRRAKWQFPHDLPKIPAVDLRLPAQLKQSPQDVHLTCAPVGLRIDGLQEASHARKQGWA